MKSYEESDSQKDSEGLGRRIILVAVQANENVMYAQIAQEQHKLQHKQPYRKYSDIGWREVVSQNYPGEKDSDPSYGGCCHAPSETLRQGCPKLQRNGATSIVGHLSARPGDPNEKRLPATLRPYGSP